MLREYNEYVGIDVLKRIVYGRARIGVSPDQSSAEISIKYGTQRAYARAKKMAASL